MAATGVDAARDDAIDFDAVRAHVLDRVAEAALEAEPFPHCYVEGVFPAALYTRLLERLPGDDRYERPYDRYPTRQSMSLRPEVAAGLDDFWAGFERMMHSQAMLEGLVGKFAEQLPTAAPLRRDKVEAAREGQAVKIGCRTLLNRDYGGFALGPHTDDVFKFVTAIFYLSQDDRFATFGTSLYRPKVEGYRSWTSVHHDHEDFEVVRTLPNRPNTMFLFTKSDTSFHGVQPGDYPAAGRNTMMWAPEIGATRRNWSPLSLPAAIFGTAADGEAA